MRPSWWAVAALSVLLSVLLLTAHTWATGEMSAEGVEREMLLHWHSAARVVDVRTPTAETTVCINDECRSAMGWHALAAGR